MAGAAARRVTLRDVAEHAGVSPTTVSFVLSGRRDMRIASATEERVLQSARMLGYRRRLAPRAKPQPGSPVVGLVSDNIGSESFAGEMIRGCIAAAAEHGHTVLMAESQGDSHLEASAIDSLLGRGVDRIIYGTMGTKKVSIPPVLRRHRVVLMNCVDETSPVPAVAPDEYAAGRLAAAMLLEAGHTDRVWLVGEVPQVAYAGRRRLAGIRARFRSAGLRLAGHVECPWWPEPTRAAVAEPLRSRHRPSALIALNDRVALGIYQAAAALGLTIPDDVSVISFDNSDLARWLDPGLSSIGLAHFDIGRRAVELLLDDAPAPGTHKVAMPINARGSIARPSSAEADHAREQASSTRRHRRPASTG
jgi:LacI family transcriptional regulator